MKKLIVVLLLAFALCSCGCYTSRYSFTKTKMPTIKQEPMPQIPLLKAHNGKFYLEKELSFVELSDKEVIEILLKFSQEMVQSRSTLSDRVKKYNEYALKVNRANGYE